MFEEPSKRNGILRSYQHLTTTHQPEEPVAREAEIERISAVLRPLVKRRKPSNLLVHGPAGVGKSTTVQYVFDQLSKHTGVKTVTINCWQYNTIPSLLTELLVQLGYPAPRKGKPVDELMNRLIEWFDKNREVALALDEFDQLSEKNQLAYDLFLLNKKAEHNIGTVMLSNQPPHRLELEPRSESRLSYETLAFSPYGEEELDQILADRVERAFHPGSICEEAIHRIVSHVAGASGDCRQALELLLEAGREAEQKDVQKVTAEFVGSVIEDA